MKSPRFRFGTGLETLEDRTMPTAFGIPWADPSHLSLSFAPDGSATPRGSNILSATFGPSSSWQREILRGFQTWASVTNLNVGLVTDGGQPLGTAGAVQGDSRFGDIRVAAAPFNASAIASSSPFGWAGTTHSGDLLFNSDAFRVGSSAALDVYSVALHEAGHILGLDHSDRGESVMGMTYAVQTGLGVADLAAIRAIYGGRSPDANDVTGGNDTPTRATRLQTSGLVGRVTGDGDLTTLSDVDYYKFTVLPTLGLTGVTVRLQTGGLSLVTPKLTVLDPAGRIIATGISTDPLNNDLTVRFGSSWLGGAFLVKVEGASEDPFAIGSYHLAVDTIDLTSPLPSVNALLTPVTDLHLNDTLSTATHLPTLLGPKADHRFDAIYRGVIEDRSDTDYYRIQAPAAIDSGPMALNVIVWGTDTNALAPRIKVFDSDGNSLPFRVLANEAGVFSIELDEAVPGATYAIAISARNPAGANATGRYTLGADFNQFERSTFDELGDGRVSPSVTQTASIRVTSGGIFQFALAAAGGQLGDGVTMSVSDVTGRVLFTLGADVGRPLTTAVAYIAAGGYQVRFTSRGPSGTPVRYNLFLLRFSEDVGPYASKTTRPRPNTDSSGNTGSPTPGTNGYTYESSSTTKPSGMPYYF